MIAFVLTLQVKTLQHETAPQRLPIGDREGDGCKAGGLTNGLRVVALCRVTMISLVASFPGVDGEDASNLSSAAKATWYSSPVHHMVYRPCL